MTPAKKNPPLVMPKLTKADSSALVTLLSFGCRLHRDFDKWEIRQAVAKDKKPPEPIAITEKCATYLVSQRLVVPAPNQNLYVPHLADLYVISTLGRVATGWDQPDDRTALEERYAFDITAGDDEAEYRAAVRTHASNWRIRQGTGNAMILTPAWGWWSEFDVTFIAGPHRGVKVSCLYNPRRTRSSSVFEAWAPAIPNGGYYCEPLDNSVVLPDKYESPLEYIQDRVAKVLDGKALKPKVPPKPALKVVDDDDDAEGMAELLGIL